MILMELQLEHIKQKLSNTMDAVYGGVGCDVKSIDENLIGMPEACLIGVFFY